MSRDPYKHMKSRFKGLWMPQGENSPVQERFICFFSTPVHYFTSIRQYKKARAFLKGSTHNNIAFISAILYDNTTVGALPSREIRETNSLDWTCLLHDLREMKINSQRSINKSVKLSINVKSYITPYFEATIPQPLRLPCLTLSSSLLSVDKTKGADC